MSNIWNTRNLTGPLLDHAVAIAENIEVVEHKGHIAIESMWDPEAHTNDSDMKAGKQWHYYEPTKDWSIAGPIIQRERISLSASGADEEPYWWTTIITDSKIHKDELNVMEFDGETPLECAMLSYVFKVFGDRIDFDAPPRERRAIVKAVGCRVEIADLGTATADDFFDETLIITARTSAEAKRIVWQKYKHYESVDIYFMGWE